MSTTVAERPVSQARLTPRIEHPLQRLRRAIRTYVVVEAVAMATIFASAWFWGTFLLDYGMFWLFGLDYLREGSSGFIVFLRVVFLGTLLAGLGWIAFKLVRQLAATFSTSSLALVLERRFAGILGDRLVTAVELADAERAKEYGFSREMLDDTVERAAESMTKVNLGSVFNWRRVVVRCGIALGLLLSVAAVGLFATDEFATWGERDLLLQTSYWPRAVLLELPDFANTSMKAVPQGGDYRLSVRALKWVVRTNTNAEGWQAVQWGDVARGAPGGVSPSAWELEPPLLPLATIRVLPETWQHASLDRVASMVGRGGDAQAVDHELGLALVERAQLQLNEAQREGRRSISPDILAFLPEEWRSLPLSPPVADGTSSTLVIGETNGTLSENLRLAAYLRPNVLRNLQGLISGTHVGRLDGWLLLQNGIGPITPPITTVAGIQQVLLAGNLPAPPLALTYEPDVNLPLGMLWSRSAPELLRTLNDFHARHSLEKLGARVRGELQGSLDELDRRATLSHVGRRRAFRMLDVPDQVTVEFEQILTEEEQARGKPRLGKPTVRRQLDGNEFVYEFKKIDRPLRFRVVAGQTVTPWHRIDVKPLPTFRKLVRTQEELGYLHGSNDRVPVGPFNVVLEGDESTFDVPPGTRLRLDGAFSKPIRKLLAAHLETDQAHPAVAGLDHATDGDVFTLKLKDVANEEVRFRLVFEDLDGIVGQERFHLRVAQDREPEFKRASYVLVNRRMITPAAVIPFTGQVQDDHGLTTLTYDVTVEAIDRKQIAHVLLPFRRFTALRLAEPPPALGAFEKRGQVQLARLLSAPGWERFVAPQVLGQLPGTGLLAWATPPQLEAPAEYTFEYKSRPAAEGILAADDEFLDTLLLRTPKEPNQPLSAAEPPAAVPYRLVIRLLATDNRVGTGADGQTAPARQTARSPEAFEFQVVSEEDLLIEVGKREEDLREASERVVEGLKDGRRAILKRLQGDFTGKFQGEGAYDFRRAANDAGDMVRILRDNRAALDVNVTQPFRDVYRELVLNRCQPAIVERIDRKICRPLELILLPGQHFSRAEDAVASLAKALETEKSQADPGLMDTSLERTDQLILRLEEIVTEMKKLLEFNEALKVLQDIIKAQEERNKKIEQKLKDTKKSELDDDPKRP